MAEFLLSDENRQRLAEMMRDINCPQNLDRATYVDLRSGRRTAVSMHGLDAIARAYGHGFFKSLTHTSGSRSG